MKTILLIILFLGVSYFSTDALGQTAADGGCTQSFERTNNISAPTDGTEVLINTKQDRAEYIVMEGFVNGNTYVIELRGCDQLDQGAYITVRKGSSEYPAGELIASGISPLTFDATDDGDYHIIFSAAACFALYPGPCESYITCTSCSGGGTITPTVQDCAGAIPVCNTNSLTNSSLGIGNIADLNSSNSGCLATEKQSVWYTMRSTTNGTLEMTITPADLQDDYDWAIWGPYTDAELASACPPQGNPLRCSFNDPSSSPGANGLTGLRSPETKTTEGTVLHPQNPDGEPGWVAPINVEADETYIMLIDNFNATNTAFSLDLSGVTLDCPVALPIKLLSFTGHNEVNFNQLNWVTATELNNDFFTLEHSSDGYEWKEIKRIKGGGNTTQLNNYSYNHRAYSNAINYYRLTQVDYNGESETFPIVSVDNREEIKLIKRVNTLGQEVQESYKGIVIEYYDDNTHRKRYNK